jgi:hypothetical protein
VKAVDRFAPGHAAHDGALDQALEIDSYVISTGTQPLERLAPRCRAFPVDVDWTDIEGIAFEQAGPLWMDSPLDD